MSADREPRRAEPRADRPRDWERRAAVTRRRVLGIGGITLLVGCAAEAGKLTSTARTKPAVHTASKTTHPSTRTAKQVMTNPASLDKPVFYVDDAPKDIALTVDDGPNAIYTPQVLRLLAKYRVTAMFSMIGIEVNGLPSPSFR